MDDGQSTMRRTRLPPTGWRRDLPDPRDLTFGHEVVGELLAGLKRRGRRREECPAQVDLREYAPAADRQGEPSDSAAAGVAALAAYFERRASGRRLELAVPFLEHVAQRLARSDGQAPADLRTTLKALVRFGAPPRWCWPDAAGGTAAASDPFYYAFGREFASIRYVRLDPPEAGGTQVLEQVRAALAAGFAAVFGCALCDALSGAAEIPFPTRLDALRGGAVLVAVGYDDTLRIRSTKGALLVRGAWGGLWGDAGFGWLPYRYLEDRLAADFWTLLKPEWLASGEFTRPML